MGGLSGLITFVGAAIAPHLSWSVALLHGLIAAVGYALAPIAALWIWSSRIDAPASSPLQVQHFISAATLPITASGAPNFIPIPGLALIWTIAGTALAAWSAWIGASQLLGLEGQRRKNTAYQVVTTAAFAPLLATVVRGSLGT